MMQTYSKEYVEGLLADIDRLEAVADAARYVLQKEGQPVSIIALDELSDALDALNKEQT